MHAVSDRRELAVFFVIGQGRFLAKKIRHIRNLTRTDWEQKAQRNLGRKRLFQETAMAQAARIQPQANAGVTRWEIDSAHSSAGFSIRHMMVTRVHGAFTKLSGSLFLDQEDP